ncbi:recombinase family protein [Lacticaseibacillus pantheris]|uniref:recombinase family protein n=1 Tax=Lacticaseibacillus pantheris TaxID=171523 RepID=UPI00265B0452|nr:recombinase family protein [Lacticaseibacillus pantheris]WKF85119.1 recombinase family protein [Lacticaseibacillus pantheris]
MRYGYARVSSRDQNLERQLVRLNEAKVECIFMEKVSGVEQDRPKLAAAMEHLKEGDELVVISLDRLSRDTEQLSQLMFRISVKRAKLIVLDMPRFEEVSNINTRHLLEDIIVSLKTYFAAEERAQIKERQRQGIELAKKRGAFHGGQKLYTADSENPERRHKYLQIQQMVNNHERLTDIMQATGCSNTLIYRVKNELEA